MEELIFIRQFFDPLDYPSLDLLARTYGSYRAVGDHRFSGVFGGYEGATPGVGGQLGCLIGVGALQVGVEIRLGGHVLGGFSFYRVEDGHLCGQVLYGFVG